MKKVVTVFIVGVLCAVTPVSTNAQNSSSVESQKPNSDYKPAFAGQTRIGAVVTKSAYEGKVITSSLRRPWGIASLPDGRFIVTELLGNIRIVTASGNIGEPIKGVPKVFSDGQGGLLGICLDGDFSNNRMVYWAFSEPVGDENLTSVAKGKLSSDEKSFENVTVIYQAKPAHKGGAHFGGRVVFTKDGNLFLSTGERYNQAKQAQDPNSGLGKVIRITTDGAPAPGNPFTGKANARPEVYSYGHRNVQGLAIHPVTGDLWEAEFGPEGW